MGFQPLINLKPTTIIKAFILNAILTAIITAFTIETRRILDENQYTKTIPDRPNKLLYTIIISMVISFITYILCRHLLGLGGGMIGPKNTPHKFFF